jgi:hypothetical protein
MTAVLKELGFTVDTVLNGSRVQTEEAIERFKNRLSVSRNSYGFLFYAGHGVQSGGINYLIPVDADIRSESYLRDRAVSVQAMLDEINQAGNELNIVVLDACRTSPFSWDRSGSPGLRAVDNQPADSIIVYATAAGTTASDGSGRNGVFTGQLLKNLRTRGLEVTEVFRLTGGDVARVSGGKQRPAVYNQFYGTAYLGSPPAQAQGDAGLRNAAVSDAATFERAVAAINNDKAGGSYSITLKGSFVTAPVAFSANAAKTIILKGDGTARTIRNNGNKALVSVPSNISFVLESGVTLDGNGKEASVVSVNGGTFTMKDGSTVRGAQGGTTITIDGDNWKVGGGVFVYGGGRFSMEGGSITDNTSDFGGGVCVGEDGTFSMEGGTITGNSVSTSGGGVDVDGTFSMRNGEISKNTAMTGGGVDVWGTFSMEGGSITGNSADWGGGVFVNGTFSMEGGSITGNSASYRGGGVFVNGTFSMEGGSITGNAASYGGGVYVAGGTFTKRGGSTIDATNSAPEGKVAYVKVDNSTYRVRNSAAGPSVNMDSRTSGSAGGWE